ncbi:uncharacterized protein [Rhodnius prolixus]|uniref:PHD-type domain-containing protein n=1 Tax=Rhodnius prolixus TaxID=13249 RepID=T1HAF0_RHOPR
MVVCPACNSTVTRDDKKSLTCSNVQCKAIYHSKCCNLKDKDVDNLIALNKTWICPACDTAKKNFPHSERPVTPSEASAASSLNDESVRKLWEVLKELAEEVRLMKVRLPESGCDFKDIKSTLDKQAELSFENSERLKKLENLLETQNKQIELLSSENCTLKKKVSALEVRVNTSEQRLLRNTIEIRGIPSKQEEVPAAVVVSVCAGLGLKISSDDLDHVERLGPRRDGAPGAVVARFVRQSLRDEVVRQRRIKRDFSTRHLGYHDSDSRVYVGDAMTATNRHLYWLARQKRSADKVKYVWFSGGRVKCRRGDGLPVVVINSPEDLDVFP